jgi:hypothetical protein
MLKHWKKLLSSECKVFEIKGTAVLPIFKVGSTSLRHSADRVHVNDEISKFDLVHVLIRNPEERFVSGLNEYCQQNNLNIHKTLDNVRAGLTSDRHFAPQYMWLLHLYKFYKGMIRIRPFDALNEYTTLHKKKSTMEKIQVTALEEYTLVDRMLTNHYDTDIALEDIIRKYKNVLS